MLRIPFTFTNPKTDSVIKFDIPKNWESMEDGEFTQIKTLLLAEVSPEGSDLLAVFSGIPRGIWAGMELDQIGPAIAAVFELWTAPPPPFLKLPIPKSVTIEDKVLDIKQDAGAYPYGVIETMSQKFNQWGSEGHIKKGTLDELIIFSAEVLAIFLFKAYFGEAYDEAKAGTLIKKIKKLPAVQTIPLASFFLSMSLSLLIDGLRLLTRKQKRTGRPRRRERRS